jgi:circadian clock protein KaiB
MADLGLEEFKGVALFTPGGDFLYALNGDRQQCWHWQLCACLQEILDLPEVPQFLLPSHTATVDRWRDPRSQAIQTFAEVYPAVRWHQPLLNAAFGTGELSWQVAPWKEGACNPMVLAAYRPQFPQLWQSHDLVVRLGTENLLLPAAGATATSQQQEPSGYILRLFISGSNSATQKTLEATYQILERGLHHPYTLKVIDIAKHPEEAEIHQIIATPTLVRVYPPPARRIVGELALADLPRVLQILTV